MSFKAIAVWEHSYFLFCWSVVFHPLLESILTLLMYFQPLTTVCNIFRFSTFLTVLQVIHSGGLKPQSSSQLPQTSNNTCTVRTVMWEDQKNPLKSRKQLSIFVRAYSYSWLEPGVRIYLLCSLSKQGICSSISSSEMYMWLWQSSQISSSHSDHCEQSLWKIIGYVRLKYYANFPGVHGRAGSPLH